MSPKPAETVVIRRQNHQFDVDGKEFPWWIERDGLHITRHHNLYTVKTTIVLIKKGEASTDLPLLCTGKYGRTPIVDGTQFPWLLTNDGYTFEAGSKIFPRLTVSFYARDVDSDGYIEDRRDLFDIDGNCVSSVTDIDDD